MKKLTSLLTTSDTADLAQSFPANFDSSSEILILGSMPGRISLAQQAYYAHPRNAFWPIMANLYEFDLNLPYPERLKCLASHKIALWDVMAECERKGSLDADIKSDTIIPNDFNWLFQQAPNLRKVCFNGQKAAQVFKRHVMKNLAQAEHIQFHVLASTSPAHASLKFQDKLAQWKAVLV